MLSSKLTEQENYLIQLFFNLYPQWEQTIYEQIQHSDLERKYDFSNYSIYFKNHKKINLIKTNEDIPVEIIFGKVDFSNSSIVKKIKGYYVVSSHIMSVLDNDAVGVRFYFNKGFLSELEVYSLSGESIEKFSPYNKQCTFVLLHRQNTGDGSVNKNTGDGSVC